MTYKESTIADVPDAGWVRHALFVPVRGVRGGRGVNVRDANANKLTSKAVYNFSDGTLGGGPAINQKTGFTRRADPVLPSVLSGVSTTGAIRNGRIDDKTCLGLGRRYKEAIEDNAGSTRIHFQFGVPAFNSLTNFYMTYYDADHGRMANTGKIGGGLLSSFGKYAGLVVLWRINPILGAINLALYASSVVSKAYHWIRKIPMSKYYYMRPAMTLYWTTVGIMVNAMAANMKLINSVDNANLSKSEAGEVHVDAMQPAYMIPDYMRNDTGGIDIRKVACRRQRLFNLHNEALSKTDGSEEQIAKILNGGGGQAASAAPDIKEYIKQYTDSTAGKGSYLLDALLNDNAKANSEAKANTTDFAPLPINKSTLAQGTEQAELNKDSKELGWWDGIWKHFSEDWEMFKAEALDGANWITFTTEYEATVNESFSNTTKASDIATSMNETSSSARSKIYNFAGGNLGDGVIAGMVGEALQGVASIVSGAAGAIGLSGLAALGGRAFIDMPEYWESSSTNFPSMNYTIKLRTPYGHPLAVLNKILIPTACVLAGVVPRSTGRNSYTGPFLCKFWHKGRAQCQLGMITAVNITRGTADSGWGVNTDLPLGIDISLTVTNLSKILHMPISQELSIDDLLGITAFDEDNNFTDYMAILSSLGLMDQYSFLSRWQLARLKTNVNIDNFYSMSHFAQWSMDGVIGALIGAGLGKHVVM